jgi:hypothetical protein
MDFNKMSRSELLVKCEELGLTKCKSKNKSALIELIKIKMKTPKIEITIQEKDDIKPDNNILKIIDETQDNKVTDIVKNEVVSISFMLGPYEKNEGYLSDFLKTIKNKNGTYKRICISPLRYAGGKSKAIGLILENLPKLKEKKVISPFFGGGSVELCLSQMLGIEVIGYDIFNMLVNFWNVLINHKDEFVND